MKLFSRKNKEVDKRKENTLSSQTTQQSNSVSEYDPQIEYTNRGLELEYIEGNPKFGQFYDTTKLIVKGKNINFPNSNVYDCAVSWYSQDDCQIFDNKLGKFVNQRSEDFKSILAQIDLHLLETDPIYKKIVMESLLNESRVKRYLDAGMMTPEEIAKAKESGNTSINECGKYIGGVSGKESDYEKFFDIGIGEKAHNIPEMVAARKVVKERREKIRQEKIANLKAQLNDLENEK